MPDAVLIAAVDIPQEVAMPDAWMKQWKSAITFVSENEGCGCCVDILRVTASQEAIDAIAFEIRGEAIP